MIVECGQTLLDALIGEQGFLSCGADGAFEYEDGNTMTDTANEGRMLQGVVIDQSARVQACRSCGKPIWWGKTAAGKSCPFNVTGRERTAVTHFSTCAQATTWSKR